MIVNTASKCGLTPQYKELEALYKEYASKGFVIVGFPANNFAGKEPGTNEEIASFCQLNYGVTFPMMDKVSVKGEDNVCNLSISDAKIQKRIAGQRSAMEFPEIFNQ